MKLSDKIPNILLLGIVAFESSLLAIVALRTPSDESLWTSSPFPSLSSVSTPTFEATVDNDESENYTTVFVPYEPTLPLVVPVLARLPDVTASSTTSDGNTATTTTKGNLTTQQSSSSSFTTSITVQSGEQVALSTKQRQAVPLSFAQMIPSNLQENLLFAMEIYLFVMFPLRKMTMAPARFVLQMGRRSTPRIFSVTRRVLLQSKLGRIIVRPIVKLGKAVRSVYRNRSKLSVVSEITYYADLPSTTTTEDDDNQTTNTGFSAAISSS